VIGGTSLFRCVRCDHAAALQEHLGKNGVWVRAFSAYPDLLRFGLPGSAAAFSSLDQALAKWHGKP
jgi:cobalamin biosynthetic protein CobC